MRKFNIRWVIPIVILLAALAVGYYLYRTGSLPVSAFAAANTPSVVSGFIEGDQVNVASEVGGRIAAITVKEGDHVSAGQVILWLDHSLLDAQIAQSQAGVKTAQAQLVLLKSQPQPSDLQAAQAELEAAQQNYAKISGGATDADIAATRAALAAAEQNYRKVKAGPTVDQLAQLKAQADNAQAALNQAQSAYDKIGGATNPYIGLAPQSVQLQQATNNYAAAIAAYNDMRSHPTPAELAAAEAQVQQEQSALSGLAPDAAQLAGAHAQVQQAQAALDRLTPTVEQLAVAQDQVEQAQAALAVLQSQVYKTEIASPVDGFVSQRAVNIGEIATPNAPLLTITKLDPVKLTIYVPETQLGEIKLGDQIRVQVDSFPDKSFDGHVVFISSQAEFTPRNVQTKEERVNTVFAVKLEIANPDSALKPGMPADATIE